MDSAMIRIALLLATMIATGAYAQDFRQPVTTKAQVDWSTVQSSTGLPQALNIAPLQLRAARSAADLRTAAQSGPLATLNTATRTVFPNAAISPVPVLLPFDTAQFLTDLATSASGVKPTIAYFFGMQTKYVLPGPSGYDAAFLLRTDKIDALQSLRYRGNVELQISGSAVLYELGTPASAAGDPVPDLQNEIPGLRRTIHEGYLRYTFLRFNAPYAVSLQCVARSPKNDQVTCAEAQIVATYFIRSLRLIGGTPGPDQPSPRSAQIERPWNTSEAFTYFGPGNLMTRTGYKNGKGAQDYTVYANIRFPVEKGPAYANSQVFMHGGDCYGTGQEPKPRRTGDVYECKSISSKKLINNEGTKENFSYPWHDNFCEMRPFAVGACPFGQGHQGQDIRGAGCLTHPRNSAKCEPYQQHLVAVRDGYLMRSRGQQALFLVVNAPNEHIRFRYLHMSPKMMDADGMLTNRVVKEGQRLGLMGNFYATENGTTVHLHFDIQVPTKDGWVWVNPYMTLVSAYERLLKAKGRQITEPPAQTSAN
jgi:hypothetical protein